VNGSTLTLGLTGALAAAGALRRGAPARRPEPRPEIWYHASPVRNRASIARHGLKFDRAVQDGFTPIGIYFTENPPPPYAGEDVWRADLTGFELLEDPYCGEEIAQGRCVYVTQDVPKVSRHLEQGRRLRHPTWGEGVIVGRHDDRSWEIRNRMGHTVVSDFELPQWTISEVPKGSRAYVSRQAIQEDNKRFFSALEAEAGEGQVFYFGPFTLVGDHAGDVLGKLEISVRRDLQHGEPVVHLGYLGVTADRRQRGFGRRLLQIVCDAADKVGLPIELEVDPQKEHGDRRPPMNKAQLRELYGKFGFKKVRGMGPDYMVRATSQISGKTTGSRSSSQGKRGLPAASAQPYTKKVQLVLRQDEQDDCFRADVYLKDRLVASSTGHPSRSAADKVADNLLLAHQQALALLDKGRKS